MLSLSLFVGILILFNFQSSKCIFESKLGIWICFFGSFYLLVLFYFVLLILKFGQLCCPNLILNSLHSFLLQLLKLFLFFLNLLFQSLLLLPFFLLFFPLLFLFDSPSLVAAFLFDDILIVMFIIGVWVVQLFSKGLIIGGDCSWIIKLIGCFHPNDLKFIW